MNGKKRIAGMLALLLCLAALCAVPAFWPAGGAAEYEDAPAYNTLVQAVSTRFGSPEQDRQAFAMALEGHFGGEAGETQALAQQLQLQFNMDAEGAQALVQLLEEYFGKAG